MEAAGATPCACSSPAPEEHRRSAGGRRAAPCAGSSSAPRGCIVVLHGGLVVVVGQGEKMREGDRWVRQETDGRGGLQQASASCPPRTQMWRKFGMEMGPRGRKADTKWKWVPDIKWTQNRNGSLRWAGAFFCFNSTGHWRTNWAGPLELLLFDPSIDC